MFVDNNRKAREKLCTVIREHNLVDTFRLVNGDVQQFTWRRMNHTQQGRLDFFLTSGNLLSKIKESNIGISYRSDHSVVCLQLILKDIEYGNLITTCCMIKITWTA